MILSLILFLLAIAVGVVLGHSIITENYARRRRQEKLIIEYSDEISKMIKREQKLLHRIFALKEEINRRRGIKWAIVCIFKHIPLYTED